MFEPAQYQLLDFGDNKKLESFAGVVVSRETPSASGTCQRETLWNTATIVGSQSDKRFSWHGEAPTDWWIEFGKFGFELRLTPSGQLGVFPEQADNWQWISDLSMPFEGLKALNLFGYTGGTTLALSAAGAEVVHVDAAKSVVGWAKQNAVRSGLGGNKIRWIVEDASRFVQRELNRGNQYDIVVADPPSFGRGPSGQTWKIQRDLEPLIENLASLTTDRCNMILLSCHTPGLDHRDLKKMVKQHFSVDSRGGEALELAIPTATGRRLASGSCFRWSRD